MPRGKKTCDKCGAMNGARKRHCVECGNGFAFKPKSKEQRSTKTVPVNWRELSKGDKIKVRGGPYFEKNGEVTPMGYNGKFVVDSLDDKGILAFDANGRGSFCHIYMGSDHRDSETGVQKVSHQLKRLIKRL